MRRLLTILGVMVVFVGAVPAVAGAPTQDDPELSVWMVAGNENFAFVYGEDDGLVGDTTLLRVVAPRDYSIDWDGDEVPAKPLRVRMRLQSAAEADWVMRGVDMEWNIAPDPENPELYTLCADGTVKWRIRNPAQLQHELGKLGFPEIKERGRGTLKLCLTPGGDRLWTSADFYSELPYKDPHPS